MAKVSVVKPHLRGGKGGGKFPGLKPGVGKAPKRNKPFLPKVEGNPFSKKGR